MRKALASIPEDVRHAALRGNETAVVNALAARWLMARGCSILQTRLRGIVSPQSLLKRSDWWSWPRVLTSH
jgi:hypothetical protein